MHSNLQKTKEIRPKNKEKGGPKEQADSPRTAHGKLKAVITPTIPSGFHICFRIIYNVIINIEHFFKSSKKL